MRRALIAVWLLTLQMAPAHAATDCTIYPKAVFDHEISAGWSECGLKDMGERALWHGLRSDEKRVMRFVFTEGHSSFFRFVTITERPNGTARMRIGGDGRNEDGFVRRRRLTVAEVEHLNALADATGTWSFPVGNWDKDDDLFIHCQLLEMERTDVAGYSYSQVNIGCSHPVKLMPLVDEVVRLAGFETVNEGRLYR